MIAAWYNGCVSWSFDEDAIRLINSLYGGRSLLDRIRGHNPRVDILAALAQTGSVQVIPYVLPFVTDAALAPHVSSTIVELMRRVTPAQLAWVDDQVRQRSEPYYWQGWSNLAPAEVPSLVQKARLDMIVIGLMTSHNNGYVRAVAIEELARCTDGREIPFLSLRANDWVAAVSARSKQLLLERLHPNNRSAVLTALPFIIRVLDQRRQGHADIERALTAVLLSDDGADALARGAALPSPVRRMMYGMVMKAEGAAPRRFVTAALSDPDAGIRASALRTVARDPGFQDRESILNRMLVKDPTPMVRRLALFILSEEASSRLDSVLPEVMLDAAASVRSLARFVGAGRGIRLDPKALYVAALASDATRRLSAAIEGVGETGTIDDSTLIQPFLDADHPRIRQSALKAIAKLDADRAVTFALAALSDRAGKVRATAVDVLISNASRVQFEAVTDRIRSLPTARARRSVLVLLAAAPKWDAPRHLLGALSDADEGVQATAVRLIERWIEMFNRSQVAPTAEQLQRLDALVNQVGHRLPETTALRLRFCITP